MYMGRLLSVNTASWGKACGRDRTLGRRCVSLRRAEFGGCGVAIAGGAILAHPEWCLRTNNGTVIYPDPHSVGKRPTVDFTVPAAAKWWASVPATVALMAGGAGGVMGGVFLDSATPQNQ